MASSKEELWNIIHEACGAKDYLNTVKLFTQVLKPQYIPPNIKTVTRLMVAKVRSFQILHMSSLTWLRRAFSF